MSPSLTTDCYQNSPKVFLSTVFQFVSNNLVYTLAWRRGTASQYFHPRRPDSLVADVDDILVQLSSTTVTGRTYHLSEDDTEEATIALQLKTLEHFKACQEN